MSEPEDGLVGTVLEIDDEPSLMANLDDDSARAFAYPPFDHGARGYIVRIRGQRYYVPVDQAERVRQS